MKKRKKKELKTETLITDESYAIHKSKGNGTVRRQVWCDNKGIVTRYSLTYVNHAHFSRDNGRVLGYDNAHGYHHRHYMGEVESVTFNNFYEIEERFQSEFEVIHEKITKK